MYSSFYVCVSFLSLQEKGGFSLCLCLGFVQRQKERGLVIQRETEKLGNDGERERERGDERAQTV